MSTTLDILDDSFPHGTPGGFAAGCRGAACPALITCRELHKRYSGDWTFKRLVDAGVSLEEILSREAAERAGIRERDRSAARTVRHTEAPAKPRTAARKPRAAQRQRPTQRRSSPAPKLVPTREEPRVAPSASTTPDRSHPGYGWLDAERLRAHELEDAGWVEQLDGYETELDNHTRALAKWKADQLIRARELRRATAALAQARIAEGTGLSLNGAIAAAVASAQADHDRAQADVDSHRTNKPAAPKKPRKPKPASPARLRKPRPVAAPRVVQPHGTNACRARGCDRPECKEAGRRYHREWVAKRQLQGIPSKHHGTPYGYSLGCKDRNACPAEISCADASRAEERRRAREAGIAEQAPRVPAEPVRQHVRALMASGWSVLAIAAAAEVSKTGLKVLLYGRSGARKGELPTAIEATKAERLMKLAARATQARSA
ncbi:hypothetical protein ACPW96_21620 [Micromonospora sp. DT81.3]|uniref:hypothetical protein n=1 Tax=Micromonospora sp. DT81.3 TaxID=3416523 RepID=UPI003CF2FA15